MRYLITGFAIFLTLAASRFVPHPPNFTSLLALSFYVPALFGIRYLPFLVFSFVLTDMVIGFHSTTLFTWGSIIFIGLMSKYFINNFTSRLAGALLGGIIFYLVTNFGVWLIGYYSFSFEGLLLSYTLAIPFFTSSIMSIIFFSILIEGIYFCFRSRHILYKSFKRS